MLRNLSIVVAVSLLSHSVAFAGPPKSDQFERMSPSQYRDMVQDAKRAYSVEKFDEAARLLPPAACAGDKESQSLLGRMYVLGQGVKKSELTGFAWLKVAAEVIFPKYQMVVRKTEEAMTPAERPVAMAEGQKYIDLYGLKATHMSCTVGASRGGRVKDEIVCTPRRDGNQVLVKRCVGPSAD